MESPNSANLSRWFDAYAARLVLYARQWLALAEAEDAVQDVFVQLLRQRVVPENPAAWLFASVRNKSLSGHRARASRRRRERAVAQDRPAWFEPDHAAPLDAVAAQTLVASLPANQAEIVILRIWGGLSFPQIASVTGAAVSTVFDQYKAGLSGICTRMEHPCNPTTRKKN